MPNQKLRQARSTQSGLRQFTRVDPAKINKVDRTIEIALSSEFPVNRGWYTEVLSHEQTDVDLSRMNNGHPFLLNHNPDDQIGVVERTWLDKDKVARCLVRFGTSARAEEIFKDICEGIRPHISVGYEHTKEVSVERGADNVETVRFAWRPYEASSVPIPADPTVGVGRNKALVNALQAVRKGIARRHGKRVDTGHSEVHWCSVCGGSVQYSESQMLSEGWQQDDVDETWECPECVKNFDPGRRPSGHSHRPQGKRIKRPSGKRGIDGTVISCDNCTAQSIIPDANEDEDAAMEYAEGIGWNQHRDPKYPEAWYCPNCSGGTNWGEGRKKGGRSGEDSGYMPEVGKFYDGGDADMAYCPTCKKNVEYEWDETAPENSTCNECGNTGLEEVHQPGRSLILALRNLVRKLRRLRHARAFRQRGQHECRCKQCVTLRAADDKAIEQLEEIAGASLDGDSEAGEDAAHLAKIKSAKQKQFGSAAQLKSKKGFGKRLEPATVFDDTFPEDGQSECLSCGAVLNNTEVLVDPDGVGACPACKSFNIDSVEGGRNKPASKTRTACHGCGTAYGDNADPKATCTHCGLPRKADEPMTPPAPVQPTTGGRACPACATRHFENEGNCSYCGGALPVVTATK